jgi:hypothetical protein
MSKSGLHIVKNSENMKDIAFSALNRPTRHNTAQSVDEIVI